MSKQTQNTEEKKVNGFDTAMGIIKVVIGIWLLWIGLQAFI